MSANADSIRVAYVAGDRANGLDAGYYIWLGDVLIGEAQTAAGGSSSGLTFKEKKRGFNQTHILCEQLSARTGLPFRRDILVRKRETAAQSTLDSSKQRRQNLKNAFAVTEDLTGKQVLLVDDIFTTGTTCNECAKELYRAGAQKVFVCCLSAAGKLS